jgi:hypothetical protein
VRYRTIFARNRTIFARYRTVFCAIPKILSPPQMPRVGYFLTAFDAAA